MALQGRKLHAGDRCSVGLTEAPKRADKGDTVNGPLLLGTRSYNTEASTGFRTRFTSSNPCFVNIQVLHIGLGFLNEMATKQETPVILTTQPRKTMT